MQRTSVERVVDKAKADEWSKIKGGFSLYRMSDNSVDYFHIGETPTLNGQVDPGAALIGRYHWNHVRWSRMK